MLGKTITLLGSKDSSFHLACNEIVEQNRLIGEAVDDIYAWGAPSECVDLVMKGRIEEEDILDAYGFTPESFEEERKLRGICAHAMYKLGL